jgi:hypothetical protein
MKIVPTPVVIEIKPEWFRHAYYVYFVTMLGDDRRMVYVGMTGDRKHRMARSPFYRMAGHFNQLSASTENQVIKGIREYCNIDDIDQAGLVRKLEQLKITYHAYPLALFEFGVLKEEHTPLRRQAERVESWLMQQLWEEQNADESDKLKVFNKKISMKPDKEVKRIGTSILEDWRDRISVVKR